MRRRAILLAAILVALVMVGEGVAPAQILVGDDRDNRRIGSNNRDRIVGGGGEDLIRGLRSADAVSGGFTETPYTLARGTRPPRTSSQPVMATTSLGCSTGLRA